MDPVTIPGDDARLFGESLTQMRSFLEREPAVSASLRRAIKGSIDDCNIVPGDLDEHIAQVRPQAAAKKSSSLSLPGFGRKIKYMWSAGTVEKQEARLHSQVQTVMLLINFAKMNDIDQQDSAVDTVETRTIISRSANDANLIRSVRDGSTIQRSSSVHNGGGLDKELDVDEELIRSPAYLATYRATMRGGQSSRSDSQAETKSEGSVTPTKSPRPVLKNNGRTGSSSGIRLSFSSLRLSLPRSITRSEGYRRLDSVLCQDARDGNLKWIESLLDEGVDHGAHVDAKNSRAHTALYFATRGRDGELIDNEVQVAVMLLHNNANPSFGSLNAAIRSIRSDIVNLMIRYRANINVPGVDQSKLPLWEAVSIGDLNMVRLLIDHGAKLDQTIPQLKDISYIGGVVFTLQDSTVLFQAVLSSNFDPDVLSCLIAASAKVSAKCDVRSADNPIITVITPPHVAWGPGTAAALISRGASVFAMDSQGQPRTDTAFLGLENCRLTGHVERNAQPDGADRIYGLFLGETFDTRYNAVRVFLVDSDGKRVWSTLIRYDLHDALNQDWPNAERYQVIQELVRTFVPLCNLLLGLE
ncbi:hypothetical protein B0H66DRAFT_608614 [Apodospora peruviana]|uniref:Ankyrin repeat protein n=1 Tax=Apodospora peruviana TaxID=516989 RepID=A0AAE0HT02_9PEZI|nr:hypothetical protein B0H66DRAFT_608614 [Apodospora peruviana]